MIASGEDSPEALSGFVKFHPQYPVLKVPGGASRPPCASRSRLARGCILRASPPRVKGKFEFGRIYCGARADSADPSGFSQLAQSLPRGPCRPSLWRSLHNRGERGRASRRDSPGGARPRATRGRETLPHTGCRQLQRGGAQAIPSATVPGRFSMSECFHHFDIEEAKARPPIRMLKHFHRVRSYTCMPNRPWPRS